MNHLHEWLAKIAAFITYLFLIIAALASIGFYWVHHPLISIPSAPPPPLSRYILKGFSGFNEAIQWSSDSRYIILGTASFGEIKGKIHTFDVLTGAEVSRVHYSEGIKALASSPAGNLFAVGTDQGKVQVDNLNTCGKGILNYTVKKGEPVTQLAWSPDGEYLAELSRGVVQLHHTDTGKINPDIQVSRVDYIAWSPDGKSLGMLVDNHEVQIWEISTNQKRQTIGKGREVGYLFAWSPDGTRIAAPNKYGVIQVWDLEKGKILATQRQSDRAALRNKEIALDWSPDGKYLATEGIEILDANTAEHVRTISATEQVTKLLWSPDGRYILAAEDTGSFTEESGVLEIWQVEKQQGQNAGK